MDDGGMKLQVTDGMTIRKAKSISHETPLEKKSTFSSPNSLQNLAKHWKPVHTCLLLFGVVFAVFLPSIQNGFFYWYGVDPLYVTENIHVKTGLTAANIRWAFASVDNSNWHPLTWISHMIDCEIFGLSAWGHHSSFPVFFLLVSKSVVSGTALPPGATTTQQPATKRLRSMRWDWPCVRLAGPMKPFRRYKPR
jgi:hypothetical protein